MSSELFFDTFLRWFVGGLTTLSNVFFIPVKQKGEYYLPNVRV